MRSLFLALSSAVILGVGVPMLAQQAPTRDPQAVAVLRQSVTAMGGVVPADSVATGSVTIIAGSSKETGTIRIQTRGLDQTSEQISTSTRSYGQVYSRGRAAESRGDTKRKVSLERAVSTQSMSFPLLIVAATVNSSLFGAVYVGLEETADCKCHHIRIWESFADKPKLQAVAEVSEKEIWIDVTTGMVRKIAYQIRENRGDGPILPVEVTFSDYRAINGIAYPFTIQTSLNGTPFSTVAIQRVTFNSGLQETQFAVQ